MSGEQAGPGVQVTSGAAALGQGSIAAGEQAVVIMGGATGPVITGSNNLIINDLAAGLQGQAIQQSLQALLAQAFTAVMRPSVEDIFYVVRDPTAVPDIIFGPIPPHLAVQPQEVPYQSGPNEIALTAEGQPAMLLVGRGGLGRTRQTARLARRLCQQGWTVCVARLDNCRKMGEPTGVLPDKKLLCVIDDLHRHMGASEDGETPYLHRLFACLNMFARVPETELLLLATMPQDAAYSVESVTETAVALWQPFSVHTLAELPPETLQNILEMAADLAAMPVSAEQSAVMVASSDGTPKTMVANVNQASFAGQSLTIAQWHNTWRGTWESSFGEAYGRYPLASAVYEAVHLLQMAGLPARPTVVEALITPENKVAETIAALVQRGLLRADDGILAPFATDQIEVSLHSINKKLPDLGQHWPRLMQAFLATAPIADTGVADLILLSEALLDHQRYADAEEISTAVLVLAANHTQAFFQRGLARARQQKHREAVADYTVVLSDASISATAYVMRGLSFFMLADYPAACADFTAAIDQGETIAYKGRGLALIFQQKFAEAIPDLTAALAGDSPEAELYYLRGMAHFALRETVVAIEDLSAAITAGYSADAALFTRGWLYAQTQNWAAAEADYSHVLEAENKAYVYFLRAQARFRQGDLVGAEADFTATIDRWQEDPYSLLLQRIGQARSETGTDLAALLLAHPEWMRELAAALPGVVLPEDLSDETLAGLSRFWGEFMENQLTGEGDHLSALYQLAGLPYLGRGLVRLEQDQFALAAADFTSAAEKEVNPASTSYYLGLASYGMGNIHEGISAFNNSLAHDPEVLPAFFWRGYGHLMLKEPAAAEADLSRAIAGGHEDIRAYRWRGRANVGLNQLAQAEADFTAVINQESENPTDYFLRGAVRHDLGIFAAAEADFDEAAARGYDEMSLYYMRGWSRFQQGKMAEAEADFSAALEREETAMNYYGRAAARYNLGTFATAVSDYTAAIDRGMGNPAAYLERAMARLEIEALAEAETDATAALSLGLDDGHVYHVRGWARLRQGNAAAAKADFDQAIAREFADATTWYGRAQAAEEMKQYAAAAADFSQAIALGLHDLDTVRRRGIAYFETSEHAVAISDFAAVLDHNPHDAGIHLLRSISYFALGDYEAAVADATEVMAQFAEEALAWQVRASAQARLGRPSLAEPDCEQAQKLAPDDPLTHECWGELYLARGQYDTAVASFEKALQIEADASRYFSLGLACLLAGQYEKGVNLAETGLRNANDSDLKTAQQELTHRLTYHHEHLQTPEAQAALQTIQQQLENAATLENP